MITKESQQITNSFQQYVKTGDVVHIKAFSRKQIEFAIIQSANPVDSKSPFYIAMQKRVADLKEKEVTRKRWVERVIFMILGSILTMLVTWAIEYLT
jgi:hypothetical protein